MTKDIDRKAFEALPLAKLALDQDWVRYHEESNTYYPNEDFCPDSAPEAMSFAWQAWQAAKAQATPDGFVLVPKEPTQKILDAFPEVEYEDTYAGACSISVDDKTLKIGYKAMIEAQEPTND